MDIERLVQKRTREQQEFVRTFSSFDKLRYRSDIDYRRKRGVLEEINRSVQSSEREAQVLLELQSQQVRVPDGEVDYSDGTTDEDEGDDDDTNSDEGDE